MKLVAKLYCVFYLVVSPSLSLFTQQTIFINYNVEDGLPQSQVFTLAQDTKGFIWAGTRGGGLVYFDGMSFKHISTTHGLPSDYINNIFVDNMYRVWAGTDKGLSLIENHKVTTIKALSGKNIKSITYWNKHLIVGTSSGLYTLDQHNNLSSIISNELFKQLPIHNLLVIGNELWIGTEKGLYIKQNNSIPAQRLKQLPYPNINLIHHDDMGNAYIGITDFGIVKMDSKKKSVEKLYDIPILRKPTSIISHGQERLWIGTENEGLVVIDKCSELHESVTEEEGLTTNKVRALLDDRWGNLWIGTSGGGLIKKTNKKFQYFNMLEQGLGGNRVYSVFSKNDESIGAAIGKDRLALFNGLKFKELKFDSIDIDVKIKSIACDTLGTYFIATEGKGLLILDSSSSHYITKSNSILNDDWINQVIISKDGTIWISPQQGKLFYLSSTKESLIKFPIDEVITSMFPMDDNSIWCATKQGNVYHIRNVANRAEKYSEGLPTGAIKCITADAHGEVFVGMPGEGVFRKAKNTQKFMKYSLNNQSHSTNIYSMVTDNDGELWIGCENGVYEFVKSAQGELEDIVHYNRDDGFNGLENCHNAAIKDNKGRLWFGTLNGLVLYGAQNGSIVQQPPALHIEEILLFYKPIDESGFKRNLNGAYILPHNKNHLSFGFKALQLNFPEKIMYRYMLDGADHHWSSWSKENKVNFANMKPGNYELLVQASIDSHTESKIITQAFEISKPFWQQWWFYLSTAFLIMFSVTSVFRYREKIIREKAALKNKELEMQNNLLSLEQKALQLQMNPHFIFNALNSIQSLIVDEKTGEARQQIQNFAQLVRTMLNNSRKKSISLKEEIEYISNYLTIEQFCQKNPFTFEINVDDELEIEEIEIPSMLIQPFIENAVIHGVSHLSTKGLISIHFIKDSNMLKVVIKDNGVGREKASEISGNHSASHVSLGMKVTSERLTNLNAPLMNQVMLIEDLVDSDGKACGTKVNLKLPMHINY